MPEKRAAVTAVGCPSETNSALKTCNDNPPETNGEQNTLGGRRSEAERGATASGWLENHFKKPFLPADDESHITYKI